MSRNAERREPSEIVVLRVFTGETQVEQEAFVKDKIILGRDPYVDVYLEDPTVSRIHATIERRDRRLMFTDHSSNGTVINGRRVAEHVLSAGDVITLGRFRVVIELHSDKRLSYDQMLRSQDCSDEKTIQGPGPRSA
jgi:pSer/pThr/pTyr-binding forkhead associated (FHA) protein